MEVNEVKSHFRIMKEAYTEVAEGVLGKPEEQAMDKWRIMKIDGPEAAEKWEDLKHAIGEGKGTAENKIQEERQGNETKFEIREEEMDREHCIWSWGSNE